MQEPTLIYEDNEATIKVVNAAHPTKRVRHIDTPWFRLQSWRERNLVRMKHIAGILNPADASSKPLGWVLHSRHCQRMMGHYKN